MQKMCKIVQKCDRLKMKAPFNSFITNIIWFSFFEHSVGNSGILCKKNEIYFAAAKKNIALTAIQPQLGLLPLGENKTSPDDPPPLGPAQKLKNLGGLKNVARWTPIGV